MPSLSRVISPPVNTCEGSGYITAPILVSSQQHYGIEVIGPGRPDVKWQANTKDGIDISQFRINWNQRQATCPQGHTSNSWTPALDHRKNEVIKIKFSTTDCGRCPLQTRCIRGDKEVQTANHYGTTAGST